MQYNELAQLETCWFSYFLLIESTKDQGMNNGNLPALAKQRKSMQGPVKHNALPSCFSWVWQSNHSSVGSFEALYFTNSAALRAALPCKISSCLPIHPGRTLPVHPTACAPNPVRIWKCFFFERSHRNTSHCSRAGCVSHARTAGSAGVNEKTAENPRSWPQQEAISPLKGDGSQDFLLFFREGRRIVRSRLVGTFGLTKVQDKKVTCHG